MLATSMLPHIPQLLSLQRTEWLKDKFHRAPKTLQLYKEHTREPQSWRGTHWVFSSELVCEWQQAASPSPTVKQALVAVLSHPEEAVGLAGAPECSISVLTMLQCVHVGS